MEVEETDEGDRMVILFEMTGDFKIQVAYNCFTVILFI